MIKKADQKSAFFIAGSFPMETLFFLRHGETAWNKARRVMGRRETPLSRRGVLQARRIARILPRLDIDAIYTSPLRRAVETARIAAEGNHAPVKIAPHLTELAFGRWEGYYPEDLRRDEDYRRFIRSPSKSPVPGGETVVDVQKRALKAIRRAIKDFPNGRLLFVSHADVIRAILCHYLRLPLEEYRRLRIDNGSLTALEVHPLWAEIKFINYLPNIAGPSKERYQGLNPALLRKNKIRSPSRRSASRR